MLPGFQEREASCFSGCLGAHLPTERSMVVEAMTAKGGHSRRAPAASSASSLKACSRSRRACLPACSVVTAVYVPTAQHSRIMSAEKTLHMS